MLTSLASFVGMEEEAFACSRLAAAHTEESFGFGQQGGESAGGQSSKLKRLEFVRDKRVVALVVQGLLKK